MTLPPDPLAIWLPEEMRDPGRVRISEVGPQWREVLPGLECRLIPEDASEPVLELRRALPGMPTHAVVEIEWAEDGADRRQKFGPWTVTPDESYAVLVSGFICGWSRGKGVEPGRCTLTTGDESIAEGAVSPWRDERGGPE